MNHQFSKGRWLLVLLLFAGQAMAQNGIYRQGVTWKKEVMREVILKMPENKKMHHGRKAAPDTSLAEMMVNAIINKALPAYSNVDHSFASPLGIKDLKSLMGITADTDMQRDYSGKPVTKITHPEFNYDSIYTYRLLEEWTFDPYNGSTGIVIKGIAPVRNYYRNDDNAKEYIGKQVIFWLHYDDASNIMERYRKKYPGNSLADALWDDYFSNCADTKEHILENTAARYMNIADTNNTLYRYWDANADTTLFTSISSAVVSGKITVYDHAGAIPDKDMYWPKPDTILIVDPTTGQEYQKAIRHNPWIYNINNVKVVEEWTFDVLKGNIWIQIKSLVPYFPESNKGDYIVPEREWGWLHFGDIKDLIAGYEQEHPADNFATKIWNSYFYSAVKPTVLK